MDNAGNVYVTSVTENAIGVIEADGNYRILHQKDTISWPDGFAIGPDNKKYVTINELHHSAVLNDGVDVTASRFKIMRFSQLAPGETGR